MKYSFDPAKEAGNQQKHKLSLAFGDGIFEDENHLILPTIRVKDEEDRYKAVGLVGEKLFYGCIHLAGRPAPLYFSEKEQQR